MTRPEKSKVLSPGILGKVGELFGVGRAGAVGILLLSVVALTGAIAFCVHSAPSTTITITCGPEGSAFAGTAAKYAQVLAGEGIKLRVLPSHGSLENLQRLADRKFKVDVGFVQDGSADVPPEGLVSLGSVAYQPLMVFTRGTAVESLAALNGKRIAVGDEGSGTRKLSVKLLEASGVKPEGATTFVDWAPDAAIQGLLDGKVDAIFLMGESVSGKTLRQLMGTPGIHLVNFAQAEAFTRRFSWLSLLKLPEGSIDLAKNIPAQDVYLVGPTVELVARKSLHPALSDVLLEAAQEVNGKPSLLQRRGEFPAAMEHDFPLSTDAARFYRSGKSFFYHYLPFWLASLTNRIVVVIVPLLVILIPVLRVVPKVYRWRVQSQIYRWYRAMLALERDLFNHVPGTGTEDLIRRLDEIEQAVHKMKIPAFFAEQFYALRGHIDFVRHIIAKQEPPRS